MVKLINIKNLLLYKYYIIFNENFHKLKFEPDNRNHYVYRITNLRTNEHYYGSRVTKLDPRADLGIKYFSSSSNKEFLKEQSDFPDNFKYKVIRIFDNPGDSILYESYLHQYFNVRLHDKFINKSNQSVFSWTNNHSPEIINKIKNSNYKIDPKTGLNGYQRGVIKTKEKMSRVDPKTGLNGYQRIAMIVKSTKLKVDPKTGLNGYQKSSLKTKEKMSRVDPKTGLNGYQRIAMIVKSTKLKVDPKTGLNGYQIATLKAVERMSKVDPITGLTGYQRIALKSKISNMKIDPETGLTGYQKARIKNKKKMLIIDPVTGLTGYQIIALKTKEKMSKVDPETGLNGYQKSGKSRALENNPRFIGYYVTPWGKYATSLLAEKELGISAATIRNYCTKDIRISLFAYNKIKRLKLLGTKDNVIGKMSNELGFKFNVENKKKS